MVGRTDCPDGWRSLCATPVTDATTGLVQDPHMLKRTLLGSAVIGAAIAAGVLGSAQAGAATEQAGEPAIRALGAECGTDSMKWGSTPADLN